MLRRWWLLPVAVPVIALWLVLRAARVPINLALWATSDTLNALAGSRPCYLWPGWRSIWGYY